MLNNVLMEEVGSIILLGVEIITGGQTTQQILLAGCFRLDWIKKVYPTVTLKFHKTGM